MKKLLMGLIIGLMSIFIVGCANQEDNVDENRSVDSGESLTEDTKKIGTDIETADENLSNDEITSKSNEVVNSEVEGLEKIELIEDSLISNSINGGYVHYYNGLTYYSREDGIYTLDKSYNRNKLINSSYPSGINVINDEIIFSAATTGGSSTIYKANIDGTGLEQIAVVKNGFACNIIVYNDKIYYIEELDAPSLMYQVSKLCSVDLTGGNTNYIIDYEYGSWITDYFIINNEIYFSQGKGIPDEGSYVENSLQKMNMDTGEVSVLVNNIKSDINYKKGNIYFSYKDEVSNLYTYNLETSEINKIINEDKNFNIENSINFTDKFIYYTDNESLYKVNYDGSNKTNCGESMKSVENIFSSDKSIWGYAHWNMNIDQKANIAIYAE